MGGGLRPVALYFSIGVTGTCRLVFLLLIRHGNPAHVKQRHRGKEHQDEIERI